VIIKYHKTDLLDRANPVLFAIVSWTEPKKPFGFTRKAFLVSNNGRIYVSRGVDKKEGTTRGRNQIDFASFLADETFCRNFLLFGRFRRSSWNCGYYR
jgi:hypothetical protein